MHSRRPLSAQNLGRGMAISASAKGSDALFFNPAGFAVDPRLQSDYSLVLQNGNSLTLFGVNGWSLIDRPIGSLMSAISSSNFSNLLQNTDLKKSEDMERIYSDALSTQIDYLSDYFFYVSTSLLKNVNNMSGNTIIGREEVVKFLTQMRDEAVNQDLLFSHDLEYINNNLEKQKVINPLSILEAVMQKADDDQLLSYLQYIGSLMTNPTKNSDAKKAMDNFDPQKFMDAYTALAKTKPRFYTTLGLNAHMGYVFKGFAIGGYVQIGGEVYGKNGLLGSTGRIVNASNIVVGYAFNVFSLLEKNTDKFLSIGISSHFGLLGRSNIQSGQILIYMLNGLISKGKVFGINPQQYDFLLQLFNQPFYHSFNIGFDIGMQFGITKGLTIGAVLQDALNFDIMLSTFPDYESYITYFRTFFAENTGKTIDSKTPDFVYKPLSQRFNIGISWTPQFSDKLQQAFSVSMGLEWYDVFGFARTKGASLAGKPYSLLSALSGGVSATFLSFLTVSLSYFEHMFNVGFGIRLWPFELNIVMGASLFDSYKGNISNYYILGFDLLVKIE